MRPLLLFIAATAALACADLRELMSLQQGLTHEFNESGINVNVSNNAYLTVTFSNSTVATLAEAERAGFARRVAECRDHYAHYSSLQTIAVGFATVTKTGPVTYSKTTVPYRFTPGDLGPPKASSKKTVT